PPFLTKDFCQAIPTPNAVKEPDCVTQVALARSICTNDNGERSEVEPGLPKVLEILEFQPFQHCLALPIDPPQQIGGRRISYTESATPRPEHQAVGWCPRFNTSRAGIMFLKAPSRCSQSKPPGTRWASS